MPYNLIQRWFIYDTQWRHNRKKKPFGQPTTPALPIEFVVPELDGLDSYETTYTAATGNIMVRLFGRNNATSLPALKAYWDDVEMDLVTQGSNAAIGTAVVAIFAIPNGATGTKTLRITSTGSCGCAAIRLAEAPELPDDPTGDAGSYSANGLAGAFVFGLQNSTPGRSAFAVAGWVTAEAHPIELSSYGNEAASDVETTWQVYVDGGNGIGTSAVFGRGVTSNVTRTFFRAAARSTQRNYGGSVCEVVGA